MKTKYRQRPNWMAWAPHRIAVPRQLFSHLRVWLAKSRNPDAMRSAQLLLTRSSHHDGFREMAFTFAVIGLAAKVASADGESTHPEFIAFCDAFPLPASEHDKIQRLFTMAARDDAEAIHHARRIAGLFPVETHRPLLRDVLARLARVATADAPLTAAEQALLLEVGQAFGLRKRETARLLQKPDNLDEGANPYAVLGVRPEASEADIRRNYHKLMREKHPDNILAQGGSQDAVLVASRQVAQLNAAYHAIRSERRD